MSDNEAEKTITEKEIKEGKFNNICRQFALHERMTQIMIFMRFSRAIRAE